MKTIFKKQIGIILALATMSGFYAFTVETNQHTSGLNINTFHDTSKNIPQLTVVEKENDVFEIAEVMPEFPGGDAALMEYIINNFVYPESAKENKKEGRVLVAFIVDTDGSIIDVKPKLPKERHLGYGLEEEVCRVISSMPKWKPGMQDGKAVKVQYLLPVSCRLSK